MPDTEETSVAALEAEAERATMEGKQSRLSAQLANLKHRLAKFEPSNEGTMR